jgi:hypothetical protein
VLAQKREKTISMAMGGNFVPMCNFSSNTSSNKWAIFEVTSAYGERNPSEAMLVQLISMYKGIWTNNGFAQF